MRLASNMVVALLGMVLVGCVPQAEFDQVKLDNMTLAAEKEAYAQRTLDAESQSDAIRKQLRLKEIELEKQNALVANLQEEKERAYRAVDNAKALMDRFNFNPDRPLVLQTALPPELDTALKNFASAHPNAVEYDSRRGVVKWKSDLLFASGSDVIREDAKSTLRGFAEVVNTVDAADFDIVVVGHTDTDPIVHARAKGHPTNWHLSAHRAIAVALQLMTDRLNPERVGVMGYGEYRPVTANDSDESKSFNRRVEIFLVGKGVLLSAGMNATPDTETTMDEPQK